MARWGKLDKEQLKSFIGEITIKDLKEAFSYMDINGIPKARKPQTSYFIYEEKQYPVKYTVEVINNEIKNNENKLTNEMHEPWTDADVICETELPEEIKLIDLYRADGKRITEQHKKMLIEHFNNLQFDEQNEYLSFINPKTNHEIAKIYDLGISANNNEFMVKVDYDLIPNELKGGDSHHVSTKFYNENGVGIFKVNTDPKTLSIAQKSIEYVIKQDTNGDNSLVVNSFINWCKKQPQLNDSSKTYADATIKSFVYMLKTRICDKIPEIQKKIHNKNLFYVSKEETIQNILEEFQDQIVQLNREEQHSDAKTSLILYSMFLNNNNKKQYWLYAAGEKSLKWSEFYNDGIMALGWEHLGDLKQYKTQEELINKIKEHRNNDSYPSNDSKANWEFANEINIGDIIYVKRGIEPLLLGRGIVKSDYIYDSQRKEFKSYRKIEWTHKGEFPVDFNELEITHWNKKTLTNISEAKYGDFCLKIEKIFNTKDNDEDANMTLDIPQNQILYGPPGTGKTFSTKDLIRKIIKNNKQPNSSVEDMNNLFWYSAIALSMYKNGKDNSYKVANLQHQKIIKAFAEIKSSRDVYNTISSQLQMHTTPDSKTVNYQRRLTPYIFDKTDSSEWKLTEEGINYVEEQLKEYLNPEKKNENKNTYFQFITFHQSYSYEEFVEGIGVDIEDDSETVRYSLKNGIFKDLCIKANADKDNKYVIVIDEINRGDISKIFGELITLIEPDKRVKPNGEHSFDNIECEENQSVLLPYSKKRFAVPNNLYIIGTMNTADRSIALLDIALRRRFDFISKYPNADIIGTDDAKTEVEGIDLKLFLNKINKRIEAYLDKDHTIGHSYLMGINSYSDFEYKFKNRILPLLLEYFYNDYEKVAKILNQDDFEDAENQFIVKECLIEDIPTYEINEKYPKKAFLKVCE